jgi:His/Glu/Gln/Arg/opine family amino acid ABC transporter permease subunit
VDWVFLEHNFRIIVASAGQTILLTAATLVLSTVLALPLALLSTSGPLAVRLPLAIYSWAARGTPELIILFFAFFGLGQVGLRLEPMPAAVLAFVAFSTAYNLEIFRGGFEGVGKGQFDAARALGLSYARMIRRIILPQVLRIIVPPYLTNATAICKHTSLASVVAVAEVTHTANLMVVATQRPFEILSLAAIIYIFLNSVLIGIQILLEKRLSFKI